MRTKCEDIQKRLSNCLEFPHHNQDLADVKTELQRCSDLHVKCIDELQPEDVNFNSKVFPQKIKAELEICNSNEAQVNQNIAQLVSENNGIYIGCILKYFYNDFKTYVSPPNQHICLVKCYRILLWNPIMVKK